MQRKVIGLEFTQTGMHAVALHGGTKSPVVDAVHLFETDDAAWWDTGDMELAATDLKQFVIEHRLHGAKTILGVPNQQIIIRYLTMPHMPDKVLKQALEVELGTTIHVPFEDPVFDAFPVPSLGDEDKENEQQGVCLVAAPRQVVAKMIDLTRRAGLRPIAVDIAPLALWRLVPQNTLPDGLILLIHMDAGDLSLSLFIHQRLYFSRTAEMKFGVEALDMESLDIYLNDIEFEIQRVVSFFNFNLSSTEHAIETIILESRVGDVETLATSLSARFQRPVIPIRASVKCREVEDACRQVQAAVGFAIKEQRKK